MPEEQTAKGEELFQQLHKAETAYNELGHQYRKIKESLDRIEPLYRKLYSKKWIRLFYLPYDAEVEQRSLMRCVDCNKLYWKDDLEELKKHKGHRDRMATEGSWWEMISLKMGWIK